MNESGTAREIHLTEEQFSGLLLGDPLDGAARAHLQACDACRQEAAKFSSSVDLFSTASLAWMAAKPAPRRLLPVVRSRERRALFVPLAWAVAAMLLILIGVPGWNRHRSESAMPAVARTADGESAAQVAEDNRLLQSVDMVLSSNEGSPLPESRLAEYVSPGARTDSRGK